MSKQTCGIYALVCPKTRDTVYIGQSVNIERRFKSHLAGSGSLAKRAWVVALREEGLKPLLRVLEECPRTVLQEREKHYIQLYKLAGASLRFMVHGRVPETRATRERKELLQRIATLESQIQLLCLCYVLREGYV